MAEYILEIAQDIDEFPVEGLMLTALLMIISFLFAYSMRTSFYCKHKLPIGIFCFMFFYAMAFFIEPHPYLSKETLYTLDKIKVVLISHERANGDERTGYCYKDKNEKYHYLRFFLCGYAGYIDPYVGKEIEVWCKNNIVYQLSYNNNIIFSLERSNKKVWLGQLMVLIPYFIFIGPCFMMYFNLLKICSEK